MRLAVVICHESQSRKAAPHQLRALSTRGCARTRLPNPNGTRNIMRPMLVVTPKRHGSPLRMPACAPAVVSMTLLGPGVTAATTAKRRKATTCSVVILYLHRIGRSAQTLRKDVQAWTVKKPDQAVKVLNDRAGGRALTGSRAPGQSVASSCCAPGLPARRMQNIVTTPMPLA